MPLAARPGVGSVQLQPLPSSKGVATPPHTPLFAKVKYGLLVSLCVLIYYSSSAAANIWNKWLVELHAPPGGGPSAPAVTPTVLTLLHLLVALFSDIVIMRRSGDMVIAAKLAADSRRTLWDVVHTFAPIAVCVTLSKLTTYLSYQYVSIALAHTAKASEPIFNVIVAALLFGEWHKRSVYLSLIPITLGIALASISDFSYNHTGFLIAVCSALMKVLQNIATKRVMDTGRFTFWEIHAYCGAASLMVLTPLLLWESARSGGRNMWAWGLAIARLPLLALAFDSLLQWASSVSAYWVLSLVSHLSATIINVAKRLLMILAGIWTAAAAGRMSGANLAGVLIAIGGVLWYNLVVAHDRSEAAGREGSSSSPSSGSGGSGSGSGSSSSGATAPSLVTSPAAPGGAVSQLFYQQQQELAQQLESSHLLGMSGIGGLPAAAGSSGAGGGGGLGCSAQAGRGGLGGLDEEQGGGQGEQGGSSSSSSSSSSGGAGGSEEAEGPCAAIAPRGSSTSISNSGSGVISRRGSSMEAVGGASGGLGKVGGAGSGGSGGSSSSSSSSSGAGSSLLTSAIHTVRTLGVPRSVLVTLGLIPPQNLRGSERRSSSGDWTASTRAGQGVGGLGAAAAAAAEGAASGPTGSEAHFTMSSGSSSDASALPGGAVGELVRLGGYVAAASGGGDTGALPAAGAALGSAASSSSSSSGLGGVGGSRVDMGAGGGNPLFSPLGVLPTHPSPSMGSLVRRPTGVPVIKL